MIDSLTPESALREAVIRVGSQMKFAVLCGVRQPTVWKWLHKGKVLPAEHVRAVETATGISRHVLRPDLFDPPADALQPPAPPSLARDHAA